MATSGTRAFTPQFADILSEAFSRILIRPLNVTQEHIDEALRSANLMLIEFAMRGVAQYQLVAQTIPMVPATATYSLTAGALDVWHAAHRKSGSDSTIWPMSRSDYLNLPDKATAGEPVGYFSDRGVEPRTITLWPVPTAADELRLWLWVRAETATQTHETLSVTPEWFDAYAAALTARMAEKFAPMLHPAKMQIADLAFRLAQSGSRERTNSRFTMVGYSR